MMTIGGKEVTKVYRGRAGKCCCGCSGTYSESPMARKRAANEITKVPEAQRFSDANHVGYEKGGRWIIAYFD